MNDIIHPKGKVYYSMGEVCEIFDVNPSLLRYWEKEFQVLKPIKNSRGHRSFSFEDVDSIKLIYYLVKEQGMTIEGANKRIRQNRDGIKRDSEIVARLRSIRSLLLEIKEEVGVDTEAVVEFEEEEESFSIETTVVEEEEHSVDVGEVEGGQVQVHDKLPEEPVEQAEPVGQMDMVVEEEEHFVDDVKKEHLVENRVEEFNKVQEVLPVVESVVVDGVYDKLPEEPVGQAESVRQMDMVVEKEENLVEDVEKERFFEVGVHESDGEKEEFPVIEDEEQNLFAKVPENRDEQTLFEEMAEYEQQKESERPQVIEQTLF